MKTTQIVLAKRPNGIPSKENFRFEEVELPNLETDEVLLKPAYISVDPYLRGRMSEAKSYIAPFEVNKPIISGAVAVVEESNTPNFKKEDKVLGMLPWSTYSIQKSKDLQKIDGSIPESYYLGVVGMPGLTAYFGLLDICKPQKGETLVVSGAAGAVGMVVGQLGKIKGTRVVGIAGSEDKVRLLKDQFGYDEVINYKTADMASAIQEACPEGVDCYYDNVGGDITDAVVSHFNKHARMALCGQISLYNEITIPIGPRILPTILKTSSLIKGFIVHDYYLQFPEAAKQLIDWVKKGDLKFRETIINGFDELPNAFLGLFTGSNTGKMIVKI